MLDPDTLLEENQVAVLAAGQNADAAFAAELLRALGFSSDVSTLSPEEAVFGVEHLSGRQHVGNVAARETGSSFCR